jgi:5-methylcytosine-specific restriction enzyme A
MMTKASAIGGSSVRVSEITARICTARCASAGRTVAATIVDHVKPIKDGGARLLWSNLQSLCAGCCNRKTAEEKRTKK